MTAITTSIDKAIAELQNDQAVAIPTETVYGLAALITREKAIRAVFSLKNRPLNHPLIVHVANDWDLTQWAEFIPDYAYQLIEQFWPGPLTLVLPTKAQAINPLITGGQDSVAIRCPQHPVAQALLQRLGTPVVAPSANPFGKVSPTTAEHVLASFPNTNLTILDGGRCTIGIESTIIDARHESSFEILRPGMLNADNLSAAINKKALGSESNLRVSGKLASHYQPEKPLYVFKTFAELENYYTKLQKKPFIIASKKPDSLPEDYFFLSPRSPDKAAFELYYRLRMADQSSAELILIELPEENSGWEGVRERILKAGVYEK